ncbi:hypothetical protein [Aliiroseovarius sp. S1123]|jgi:hypothetical protein|uniref:hypothetical protein n=1 Tax=unclassified Aliiroseovarius TaxID=2623558 RepID=UPI001FF384A3|nr:hypothetical protein [Aliiroseovarius sp. S1123]MCK0170656.1 hypothetical protein [Aliiroseovarius sp. S1123]
MTTEMEGFPERGGTKDRIAQLSDAAQMVQDFTYDFATHLDPITMTELMVTSRRLERLAQRLAEDPAIVAALATETAEKTPPKG